MSGLVDWGLASTVARHVAGADDPSPRRADLAAVTDEASDAVCSYTGLDPAGGVPEPEWIGRADWAEANLATFAASFEPIERRLRVSGGLAATLEGPLSATLGRVAGAQLGVLVGYASRRVLGQYEFPIITDTDRPARLLFVAPNVEAASAQLGADADSTLRWIALHEVTHAVHFAATPWLRPHLSGLASELIATSRLAISPGELAAAAARSVRRDPRAVLRELGESDPLTLLTPADSRGRIEQVQATMAAIEGFAEHVMDAAAPGLGEDVGGLREAMERRRERRGPLARLLSWLLGIELKLRQYRDGKRFADEVVDREGIEALNRAWSSPVALPSIAELAEPSLWLARCRPAAVR